MSFHRLSDQLMTSICYCTGLNYKCFVFQVASHFNCFDQGYSNIHCSLSFEINATFIISSFAGRLGFLKDYYSLFVSLAFILVNIVDFINNQEIQQPLLC